MSKPVRPMRLLTLGYVKPLSFQTLIWWPSTMRAQRGLILLLLLLAVFCSTAVSLKCYNCLDPVSSCKINTTCSPNLDSCLYAVAGRQVYQQCWKLSDCNSNYIMSRLDVAGIQSKCCQWDLCNKNLDGLEEPNNAETSSLRKTALLGTSVLVAILKFCF
ncbi:CD59B glycoprotein isoform X2 [Mus musculus]|uniref:CD59B glycoprotein isoform X2 n=1 Tax=Mus musculus TaxID=10090 RepID=UPI0003D74705|nr:CD59B glycoprotein isoform X2 [Mus musculus]|eukprot:XP_006499864.1 PREDICTED: CD59B glycoprotein isoform X2 [Mus musculus]